MRFDTPLPIDAVLPEITAALVAGTRAVLMAPPGAGKTTRVPLALLDAPWLGGAKILVLEPRRLAARAAAHRMALTLGENVGETVGVRARLASQIGPTTRIEVITEGVFTRMILDDPTLDGIGAVLFDEYHERSLDADLGLALALDAQAGLREDLRILVMSATLDGARVASLLGDAPVIVSEGRAFAVTTRYLGRDRAQGPGGRIDQQMTDAVLEAVRSETGSILAFLPGQGEIRRTAELLAGRIRDPSIEIAPLFGAMDISAQDRAVRPAAVGRRKIVLATSIAETSLTIEGVRVVIDCGVARVPRFEPDVGVTRLETVRVSRAAADQRRGRAGRTEPGVCYRLWDEPQTMSLAAFAEPEIKAADLTGLVLDCAAWGVTDATRLAWLDAPPHAALRAARDELVVLGAVDETGRVTALGQRLRALPLPPRLASMVVQAATLGAAREAAEIAAVLVERGLGGSDTDLDTRLQGVRRDRSNRAQDMMRLARGWAQQASSGAKAASVSNAPASAELLALAFPGRIAKARGAPGQFILANGRAAALDAADPLSRSTFLVVAEMAGRAAATRIILAARLEPADFEGAAAGRIEQKDELTFDANAAAVRARRVRRLGAIRLESEPRTVPANDESARVLAEGIAGLGIGRLPWSKTQTQLRARVAFLRAAKPVTTKEAADWKEAGDWPDLGDEQLRTTAALWLAPFLTGKSRLAEIGGDDLSNALDALIPWDLRRRMDAEAPTHFDAPTGNHHAIDYEGAGAPALHIRVQELFGLSTHPTIAQGRLPLTLVLLSPAHRPIQITRDLPGFWKGSWSAVKSDMRGRYPRHVWPDDPASAAPTARAKPRGT